MNHHLYKTLFKNNNIVIPFEEVVRLSFFWIHKTNTYSKVNIKLVLI